MAVKTSLKVKQDYLLSLKQAQKAAGGVLDPKQLLIKVNLRIELQTKETPNPALLMLLEKEVDSYLLDTSKKIESKVTAFVDNNKKKPDFLEKKLSAYTNGIRKDFQKEVDKVVGEKLKKVARDDQNLREARIVVAFKAVGGVVKLAGAAAALAGGNAAAIIKLATTIKDLAELAHKALSTEEARLKTLLKGKDELEKSLSALEKARDTAEKKSGLDGLWAKLKKAKDWKSWKDKCSKAESARKDYRNSTTKSRQHIEKMAKPMDDLEKAMKGAKTVKEGVKIGSNLMTLKRTVRVALEGFKKKEQFLVAMGKELVTLGADVDDRTWKQKLTGFKKAIQSKNVSEIAKLGKEGGSAMKEIYSLAKDIKSLTDNLVSMA